MFLHLISLPRVWGLDKFNLVAFSLHSDHIPVMKSTSILRKKKKRK